MAKTHPVLLPDRRRGSPGRVRLVALFGGMAVLGLVAACHPSGGDHGRLTDSSGVVGAGAGPSTAAALLPAAGGKSGLGGTESTQTESGPHAGGPH